MSAPRMKSARNLLFLAAILAAVLAPPLPAFAQSQDKCTTTVLVTPYQETKGQASTLEIADLTLRAGNKPYTIASLKPTPKPLRAILVLDGSASVQLSALDQHLRQKWQVVLNLAEKIVTDSPPGSMFGLLAFSGEHRQSFPLTADSRELMNNLNNCAITIPDLH